MTSNPKHQKFPYTKYKDLGWINGDTECHQSMSQL